MGEGSSIINEACPLVHPSFFLRSTTCNTTTMPKNVCRRATLLLPTQPLRPLTTHHIQAYETHRENGSKRLLARVPRSSSSKISNGGSPLMLLPGRAKKKQQANRIGKTRAGGLVSLFSSPLDRGVGGEEGKQTLALWVLSALRPAATHPPQPIIPLACVFTGLDDTIAGNPTLFSPKPWRHPPPTPPTEADVPGQTATWRPGHPPPPNNKENACGRHPFPPPPPPPPPHAHDETTSPRPRLPGRHGLRPHPPSPPQDPWRWPPR